MSNLTDAIERYLNQLLAERETLELQRRELARLFRCAPSQINYVLETRFTSARGYVIESRRGGGGFIRITRLPDGQLTAAFGERVDPEDIPDLLAKLVEEGLLSGVEGQILQQALGAGFAGPGIDPAVVRAKLLRTMLMLLGRKGR